MKVSRTLLALALINGGMGMIYGLIPARSGSKGIKDKNIYLLGGHPLLAWSVAASKLSGLKTVVTTDSAEYAEIAKQYGAEALMRPPVSDDSGDGEYLLHFIDAYPEASLVVLLRPTTPLRDYTDIIEAPTLIRDSPCTSLRSSYIIPEPYQKCFRVSWGFYEPITCYEDINQPRQHFSPTYHPNGYVDILRATFVRSGELYGDRIMPFITPNVGEIETAEDLDYIEWRLEKYGSPLYEYLGGIK